VPGSVIAALQAFRSAFNASVNLTTIPGGSAAVAYRGDVLGLSVKGLANFSSGTEVSPSTLFRIGSVSKVFVAILVNQAAASGEIRLDDPVSVAVPGFTVVNPYGSGLITWRHLMEQRSGLQRETPYGCGDTACVLKHLSTTPLIQAPGGPPSYSNLGFALAGNALAERVVGSGATFRSLVAQRIAAPLGLRDTGGNYTAAVLARLAVPFCAAAGVPCPFAELGWDGPAGGMFSTPAELVRVASALMAAARGAGPLAASLPQDAARALLDPVYWNSDGLTVFGAPWEMRAAPPYLERRKGGNLPGFSTLLAFVPELELALAAAWNGGADEFTESSAMFDALLPPFSAALSALAPSPFVPGPAPGDYEGTYQSSPPGVELVVQLVEPLNAVVVTVQDVLSIYANDVSKVVGRPDTFQTVLPDGLLPCLAMELAAYGRQYVFFTRDASGRVTGASIPGIVAALTFSRA